jgi:hypothetical protein
MKKVLVLATAAFLFTGVAFAGGDGKEMKDCKMKEGKAMKDCCKKEAATASKTTTKSAAKKA